MRLSEELRGGFSFFLLYYLLALFIVWIAIRSPIVIFDKVENLYTRQIETVLETRTKTYRLSDINSIEITESQTRYLDKRYQLKIGLRSSKSYTFPAVDSQNRVREIADRCQKFLDLR